MKQKVACGPGLLVGIPTLGRPIPLEWAMAYKGIHPPINYNTHTIIVKGKPIDVARNEIAAHALEIGSKYLFFLGDDVEVPLNCLKQLIFRMEQNDKIGVCGAVYSAKCDPPAPLIFRENGQGSYWDWKIGEFFTVTGLGMDATIIRTSILEKMSKPWFKTVDTDNFSDAINNAEQWTEDLYFCKKVIEETEYQIYVDTSLICKHWDVYNDKYYTLPTVCKPLLRQKSDGKPKAIDIGCGPIDRTEQFSEYSLTRVDIREECNPDYRCDVTSLPFANNEFDLVFSSHVLEHFPRGKWNSVLDEWIRVLKPDGELMLVLPNIDWAVEAMTKKEGSPNDIMNVLYGGQTNDFDFHYTGFNPGLITEALTKRGFNTPTFEFLGYNMISRTKRGNPTN
jgi:SAM-dependent methyltransferase